MLMLLGVAGWMHVGATGAHAQSFRQGVAAFQRQDYVKASRTFIPLAERGNAAA
ncbi:hypothetical protein [Bradyrhizobium sp. RT3a]|uniref:hypothetical protein n=1 Tax=unclassified Bradyrhizobium TaxID=2631580 RepID=UPI00339B4AE7